MTHYAIKNKIMIKNDFFGCEINFKKKKENLKWGKVDRLDQLKMEFLVQPYILPT